MLESKTARWSTGTALLCVVLLAIAWFLVVSPRRAQADQVQAQVVTQQQQNDQLRTTVEQLKAEYVQLPATRAKLAEIRSQLPPTEDTPGLLRTVESLASGAGVKLLSFAPGDAQQLGANGSPVSAAQSNSAVLAAVPLTIMLTGEYFQVVAFLRQLQTAVPRAFLITGLQFAKADAPAGGTSAAVPSSTSASTSASTASAVKVTIAAKVFSMPTGAAQSAATVRVPVTSSSIATGTTPSPTVTPTQATASPKSTGAIALPLPQATGSPRW